MARYYDADWLVDDIKLKDLVPLEDEDAQVVIDWLENFPTVDIVRCGECKYWKDKYGCADSEEPKFCYNWGTKFAKDHNYKSRTPDDFCSRGERR